MIYTPYFAWMWFWCWLCFRIYLAIPTPRTHESLYGKLALWLLGYAGAYAHSNLSNFHLCRFFYGSDEAQCAAWDRYLSAITQAQSEHPVSGQFKSADPPISSTKSAIPKSVS